MVVVAYKIIETPKLSWYHCKTGNSDTVNYRGQAFSEKKVVRWKLIKQKGCETFENKL